MSKEEFWNSFTHFLGALLGIAGLTLMVVYASLNGDAEHIVGASIFGACLVFLYSASTIYHALTNEKHKKYARFVDHSAIFLLIAGTYTPFTLSAFSPALGWALFGIIWGLSLLGIIMKIFWLEKTVVLATVLYALMGWSILLVYEPLKIYLGEWGVYWMIIGGLSYTFGIIFFAMKKTPFAHTLWHLFVIGGSVCHFFAVFWYLIP